MKDVCDAFLAAGVPANIPPVLSYLVIALALFITIPSTFIVFANLQVFHYVLRIVNLVVTVLLIFFLSGNYQLGHNLAFSTNWTSFFTLPILAY